MATIVNISRAKGDNTNASNGQVSINYNGDPTTKLTVVKTADVTTVVNGDTFTYTIKVTNNGSGIARAVVMTDNAPQHINFIVSEVTTTQGLIDVSSNSAYIQIDIGDIAAGETVTITIPATVVA